jgi:hypothetical protein
LLRDMSLYGKHLRRLAALTSAVASAWLAGCAADGGRGPTLPSDATLRVVDGSGQLVAMGARAPRPLAVRLTDGHDRALVDAVVSFEVTRGEASLLEPRSRSGGDGIARSEVIVYGQPGDSVQVVARAGARRSAPFTLRVAAAPALTSVEPAQLRSGDTITLRGAALTGARVRFGQTEAMVLSDSDTLLRAVAPACLPPGDLWVRVERDGARSAPRPLRYDPRATLLQLPAAGYAVLDGAGDAGCAVLPGDGARYVVTMQFGSGEETPRDLDVTLEVSGESGAASEAWSAGAALAPAARFEALLRQREAQLAASGQRPRAPLRMPTAPPALGTLREYPVIATLDASRFDTVTVRLRTAGTNVLVWVDTAATVADSVLTPLARWFDGELYADNVAAFGLPSDVDGDGRVHVVLTPVVNGLTRRDQCSISGFVAGFVSAHDLFPGTPSAAGAEAFYAYVPDADGRWGCVHSTASWARTLPLTFVHELQHLINYHEKVFRRGGREEAVWLNEALSHFAEELASERQEARYPWPSGRASPDQLFPDTAGWFILNNMINSFTVLRQPWRHSLTAWAGGGTLEERGAGWLFVRWLRDRYGEAAPRRLVQSPWRGTENVAMATGQPFDRLAAEFSLVPVVDSLPERPRQTAPDALRMTTRTLRALFARLGVILNLPSFPVTPSLPLPGQPVRGPLRAGGWVYAEVEAVAGQPLSLRMRRSDGMPWAAADRPRLAIFRLP